MSDMISNGIGWLNSHLGDSASQTVTYTRATGEVLTVSATRGRTRGELVSESGMAVQSQITDWIILVADLGSPPARGDTITEAGGTVWEVRTPGEPEPDWVRERQDTAYRIHVKRATTTAAASASVTAVVFMSDVVVAWVFNREMAERGSIADLAGLQVSVDGSTWLSPSRGAVPVADPNVVEIDYDDLGTDTPAYWRITAQPGGLSVPLVVPQSGSVVT